MMMLREPFSQYFDDARNITSEEFLKEYDLHIRQRESFGAPEDQFEKDNLTKLLAARSAFSITCYRGLLNANGLDNLILPHHDHGFPTVPPGGERFHDVIRKFRTAMGSKERSPCVEKIEDLDWAEVIKSEEQSFLWMSNSKEDAHPGHFHGGHGDRKIYMGNGFHRLVAYGLWAKEPKPLLNVHFVLISPLTSQ